MQLQWTIGSQWRTGSEFSTGHGELKGTLPLTSSPPLLPVMELQRIWGLFWMVECTPLLNKHNPTYLASNFLMSTPDFAVLAIKKTQKLWIAIALLIPYILCKTVSRPSYPLSPLFLNLECPGVAGYKAHRYIGTWTLLV